MWYEWYFFSNRLSSPELPAIAMGDLATEKKTVVVTGKLNSSTVLVFTHTIEIYHLCFRDHLSQFSIVWTVLSV